MARIFPVQTHVLGYCARRFPEEIFAFERLPGAAQRRDGRGEFLDDGIVDFCEQIEGPHQARLKRFLFDCGAEGERETLPVSLGVPAMVAAMISGAAQSMLPLSSFIFQICRRMVSRKKSGIAFDRSRDRILKLWMAASRTASSAENANRVI